MDACGLTEKGHAVITDMDVARPLDAFNMLLAVEGSGSRRVAWRGWVATTSRGAC